MTKIGLLGCGSWGTTLAQILANKGEIVNAWHYRKDFVFPLPVLNEHLDHTRFSSFA